jgi:hypothetical protein
MAYPVVTIECTDRGVSQQADVIDYSNHSLRVAVQGTSLAIDLRWRDSVYVGSQAGLEFICRSTYAEIAAQNEI